MEDEIGTLYSPRSPNQDTLPARIYPGGNACKVEYSSASHQMACRCYVSRWASHIWSLSRRDTMTSTLSCPSPPREPMMVVTLPKSSRSWTRKILVGSLAIMYGHNTRLEEVDRWYMLWCGYPVKCVFVRCCCRMEHRLQTRGRDVAGVRQPHYSLLQYYSSRSAYPVPQIYE